MSTDFEIIVGTYEQFLLGYKVHNDENTYTLERSFATHSHLASIRAVASNRHYLASAGADDSVFLYDMRYRVESGRLMHHTDTINCIEFTPDASHIITASNDGSIGIVRCGNWQLEKHWQAPHKENPVNAIAIHPSGKMAMSTGGDGVLRTWNLVKGRAAYATNLVPRLKLDAKQVTILKWSPNGEKYLLVSNCKVDVYSAETAGLCAELSFNSKVVCVEFVKDDVIVIGHENGKLRLYDLVANTDALEIEAHDARVKCLAHRNNYLVSASSSGEIKLWRFGKKKLNMLSRATCGVRITCMTLTHPCPDLTVKREEPKPIEAIEKKKNVFRMRQEVTVEDEGEDEPEINQGSKKIKKKSRGKKRAVEVEQEEVEKSADISNKEKKKKKVPFVDKNGESTKKKKRKLSIEKSEITLARTANDSLPKNKIFKFDDDEIVPPKKKKKQNKAVPFIEKPSKPLSNKRKQQPSKPLSNKRKQQNGTTSTTGFSSKTKKKKVAK